MAEPVSLFINEVVDGLDPVLQRLGFEREQRGLYAVEDDGDLIIASWLREPPEGRYPANQRVVGADGVSVWRTNDYTHQPGYVNVGIGSTFARFEWRKTHLDGDEFAATIKAYIGRYDNFDIPAYLQRGTRGRPRR